ncbi:Na/Pi symporter [Congregibacter variabilis]|uniref:Na/Pi symporter n=1 Tax=Congregibacter variabilis TaxID=3081200 RepID=A0ABZ0I6F4_9GAMM|nr:Na/Pi symporter [Congregibacter sp. IMCC43200]
MTRKFTFPVLLLALAYALWMSTDFVEIAAGIALFMFGMLCLEAGFKFFTGGPLEAALQISTDKLWKSLSFGVVSTTMMQSSSLVSLITVSFVGAEMITLAAGMGIIMGANIGTTTGAWLIAGFGLKVNIAAYAMPVLVFGVLFRLRQTRTVQALGDVMLGFAFLFLGIHYMKIGFEAFQGSFDLSAYAIAGFVGVVVYTCIGMLITVVMQSSHATLLIIITALAAGQVSYENALALAIGANLGSTITIVLGSLSSNIGGKRLAAFHVLFNLITALFAIFFITQLAKLVDMLALTLGIPGDDALLKLALFHSLFNILGVTGFVAFVNRLEQLLQRLINAHPQGAQYPQFLFAEALETPATAVNAVSKEVEHLMENAFGLLAHGLSLRRQTIDSEESLSKAVEQTRRIFLIDVDDDYEASIKGLHTEIIAFIASAQARESNASANERLFELRRASRSIVEAVKAMKHLHKNLRRHGLSSNPSVRARYNQIRLQIAQLLREIRKALREEPGELAVLSLDVAKLEQEKIAKQLLLDLDDAIRQRKIPVSIVTSVMNDEDYAQNIGNSLLRALAILRSADWRPESESLALSNEDINELLEK